MKSNAFIFYVKEIPRSTRNICSPCDIYFRMMDLAKADQESFWAIGYNSQNQEVCNECLFIGGVDQCSVDKRILFKRLLMAGASKYMIIHNHPGGDCKPSKGDIKLTNKIKEGSEILDLELLDHVIIAEHKYCSFKEDNLLN